MRVNLQKEAVLSAAMLRAVLDYNPHTGVMSWKQTLGSRAIAGLVAGTPHHTRYLHLWLGGFQYLVHRLAWLWMTGEWPIAQIDHINRDRSDNRWLNLRAATHGQNRQNSRIPKNNTSGRTGVSFVKATGRWHAYLYGGKRRRINLGFYNSYNDAVRRRNEAIARHFGEFAPQEGASSH
jgi:hypothetical protein